jgi:hypothetical protein
MQHLPVLSLSLNPHAVFQWALQFINITLMDIPESGGLFLRYANGITIPYSVITAQYNAGKIYESFMFNKIKTCIECGQHETHTVKCICGFCDAYCSNNYDCFIAAIEKTQQDMGDFQALETFMSQCNIPIPPITTANLPVFTLKPTLFNRTVFNVSGLEYNTPYYWKPAVPAALPIVHFEPAAPAALPIVHFEPAQHLQHFEPAQHLQHFEPAQHLQHFESPHMYSRCNIFKRMMNISREKYMPIHHTSISKLIYYIKQTEKVANIARHFNTSIANIHFNLMHIIYHNFKTFTPFQIAEKFNMYEDDVKAYIRLYNKIYNRI